MSHLLSDHPDWPNAAAPSYTPEQLLEIALGLERGVLRPFDNELSEILRAHAAALEENAKLRKHAESMWEYLDAQVILPVEIGDILRAYRADFPKEPR